MGQTQVFYNRLSAGYMRHKVIYGFVPSVGAGQRMINGPAAQPTQTMITFTHLCHDYETTFLAIPCHARIARFATY
jgi:hypothetical protein